FADNGPSDTIHLKGNLHASEAIMIKVTQAEIGAAFSGGGLAAIMNVTSNYANTNPFLYIPGSNNIKIAVSFDFYLTLLTLNYLDANGNLVSVVTPFSHTLNGIYLQHPIT